MLCQPQRATIMHGMPAVINDTTVRSRRPTTCATFGSSSVTLPQVRCHSGAPVGLCLVTSKDVSPTVTSPPCSVALELSRMLFGRQVCTRGLAPVQATLHFSAPGKPPRMARRAGTTVSRPSLILQPICCDEAETMLGAEGVVRSTGGKAPLARHFHSHGVQGPVPFRFL